MRPEGPTQNRSAAPSVLIIRSILSRPDGPGLFTFGPSDLASHSYENYAALGGTPTLPAANRLIFSAR
jgi:hypothetical protein